MNKFVFIQQIKTIIAYLSKRELILVLAFIRGLRS